MGEPNTTWKKHKIRKIAQNQYGHQIYGITIPHNIANNFPHCYFTISTSGNAIILESGTHP